MYATYPADRIKQEAAEKGFNPAADEEEASQPEVEKPPPTKGIPKEKDDAPVMEAADAWPEPNPVPKANRPDN